MPSRIAQYINQPNLKNSITDLKVVQGTARETGNVYYAVELTFINGYKKRMFLRNEEEFCWCDAFEQLQTAKQIDASMGQSPQPF